MNLNEQREFLRKNNLEMTLKLDKIIEDAKPKPKTEKKTNYTKENHNRTRHNRNTRI